jgi:hypothetical protein
MLWILAAAGLLTSTTLTAWLSPQLAAQQPPAQRPLMLLAAFYGLSFCAFAAGCSLAAPSSGAAQPRGILLVALSARLLLIPSALIESDDAYRYILDGQTLLAGENPYAQAPGDLLSPPHPPWLARALPQAEFVLRHINHPHLPTIYPPLAQVAFAAAAWLQPWSYLGPRLVFIALDVLTILVLSSYLRRLRLPAAQIVYYAWNPLVIQEVANGAHADSLAGLLVVLLAGRLLAIDPRAWPGRASPSRDLLLAGLLLGLSVLAKVLPVVLAPVALAAGSRRRGWSGATVMALAAAAVVTAGYLPFCTVGAAQLFAGLGEYARHWINNAGAYQLLAALFGQPRIAALVLIAAASCTTALRLRRCGGRAENTIAAMQHAWLICLLLLPACFPWYAVPLLALSALRPAAWAVVLTAAFGLFYVAAARTHAGDANSAEFLQLVEHAAIWIAFLPDLISGFARRRSRRQISAWNLPPRGRS